MSEVKSESEKEESWGDYFRRYWGHTAFITGWLIRIATPYAFLVNEWIGVGAYLVGVALWLVWIVSVLIWVKDRIFPPGKTEEHNDSISLK